MLYENESGLYLQDFSGADEEDLEDGDGSLPKLPDEETEEDIDEEV